MSLIFESIEEAGLKTYLAVTQTPDVGLTKGRLMQIREKALQIAGLIEDHLPLPHFDAIDRAVEEAKRTLALNPQDLLNVGPGMLCHIAVEGDVLHEIHGNPEVNPVQIMYPLKGRWEESSPHLSGIVAMIVHQTDPQ